MILLIGIILIIIGLGLTILFGFLGFRKVEKNIQIETENKQLEEQNKSLQEEAAKWNNQLSESLKKVGESCKTAAEAFENYFKLLEEQYQKEDEDYDRYIEILHESYERQQDKLQQELAAAITVQESEKEKIWQELEQLKLNKAAAIEAVRREEEIKQQKEFYSLKVSDLDLNDIRMLEKIKPSLNKPRVLSMLIWTTWFRASMTTLCNNVLGTKVVTGIYKITNQLNNKCYVGQAVDIAERWKEHAKKGLQIDTPSGNKLYAAMIEDGIWNFTWELLEVCPQAQLNEREKFYIELYDSKNYGYNGNAGINK